MLPMPSPMPRSACASRRVRPGRSISAPPGRRCSTTSTPVTRAGRSCSASRTPTRPATRSPSRRTSSTGCTGSGSAGTRGRRSPARRRAARSPRTASCSASRSMPRRPRAARRGQGLSLLLHARRARRRPQGPGGGQAATPLRRSVRRADGRRACRARGRGSSGRHPLPGRDRRGRLRRHRPRPGRDRRRRTSAAIS